jgi:hypothetical protein
LNDKSAKADPCSTVSQPVNNFKVLRVCPCQGGMMLLLLILTVAGVVCAQTDLRFQGTGNARALAWKEHFSKLDVQLPTLSPTEEQWLKTEIDATIATAGGIYTPRALDAMDSREYQIRVAKPHILRILQVLQQLAVTAANERQRAALWTQFAVLIMDKQFWQAIDNLARRKIVQKTVNGYDSFYYENHVSRAQEILTGIVLPYLNSRQ